MTTQGPTQEQDAAEQTMWTTLRAAAVEAAGRAYAPYSGFHVGAAALAEDGRTVVGCNVENASYGLTLCAECGLVTALHATGGGRLTHFVCVGSPAGREPQVVMPCGRCRQLLWEHGGAALQVETPRGVIAMSEVLPQAFDAGDQDGADQDGADQDGGTPSAE